MNIALEHPCGKCRSERGGGFRFPASGLSCLVHAGEGEATGRSVWV